MKFYPFFQLLVFLCLCGINGWCNQPRRSAIHIQYSENGEYYYRSIPFSAHPNISLGKTIVYKTSSKEPVYELNQYLDRNGYLSDDGNTIAFLKKYITPPQYIALDSQHLIEIFKGGRLARSLNYRTLITECRLAELNNQGNWLRSAFVHKDSLFLFNAADQVVVIDLNADSREKTYSAASIKKRFALARPESKSGYEGYSFSPYRPMPTLANGHDLQKDLKHYLRKEAVLKNIADIVDQVVFSILVDRSGSCTLYSFEPYDKRLKQFEPLIAIWVAAQKINPERIPEQVDQWLFEGYLEYK